MTPSDLDVAHHAAQLGDLRMHWVEAGQGPLVVLLHGFPECWWSWRYQLGPLARAGFRVVAPDLRGYGDTDKHGPYDLDTLTRDVCHLIEHLGEERAHVVGHDWGGGLAWWLAATRPDRCRRLVVLNCPLPHLLLRALLQRPRLSQLKRSAYMFFFQLPWLPERALTRNDAEGLVEIFQTHAVDGAHFSTEELRPIRDAVQQPGAAAGMLGWYRTIFRQALTGRLPPLPKVAAPALLIWGMEDQALGFDDCVPGTEAWVPDLRIEKIERCGHFVQAERDDRVNPLLLDFLRAG